MGMIFFLSSQSASQSSQLSETLSQWIITVLNPFFPHIVPSDMMHLLHPLIRKVAHFAEYALLGFLLLLYWRITLNRKHMRALGLLLLALSISILFACTDEWHQLYVNGRSGQPGDVLIDSCGAATGSGIAFLLSRRKKHKVKSQSKK